uniref:R-spondin-3 n=1 Tax=Ornithorhynchus anatinus TaxID=9258 RepID=F6USY9_ORNAN
MGFDAFFPSPQSVGQRSWQKRELGRARDPKSHPIRSPRSRAEEGWTAPHPCTPAGNPFSVPPPTPWGTPGAERWQRGTAQGDRKAVVGAHLLLFRRPWGSQNAPRGRRQRRMHPNVSQGCQGGCATCSDYNGCLSCKPRLFFVLERIGMKQIGVCLSSCPSGYFGTRYPDINKCTKCKAECETCFTRTFCTKCKNGYYIHMGKCLDSCPEGLETNNHTMECTSVVHCEASEWSSWGPCTKKGKTCGFKRGTETRIREIVQHPSAKGSPCPAVSETRKCTVQRKKCQKGERGKKGRERKRKKLNKEEEEGKDPRPELKGQEPRRESLDQRENKDKQQQKKRKAQDKQQKSVSVGTVH